MSAQADLYKCRLTAIGDVEETNDPTIVPVVQEEQVVSKRIVETGQGIRVTKTISEREVIVDELLARNDVVVERVAINEVVDIAAIPRMRYENDTMIVPVLEEVLIVEKRTILKEELRITSTRSEAREVQSIVLRNEEVSVERSLEQPGQQSTDPALRESAECVPERSP